MLTKVFKKDLHYVYKTSNLNQGDSLAYPILLSFK